MGPGKQWSAKSLILPQDCQKEFESHIILDLVGFQNSNEHAREQIEQNQVNLQINYLTF